MRSPPLPRLRSLPALVALNVVLAAWLAGGGPSYDATAAFPEPRATVCLSGTWSYYGPRAEPTPWKRVRVPETYDPTAIDRKLGWFERSFFVPSTWRSRGRVVLRFDKVQHAARIMVNDRNVGEHFGNRVGFDVDVTDAVDFGRWNWLRLRVDGLSSGRAWPGVLARTPGDARYYTTNVHRPDDAWIGGDVWLQLQPAVRLEDPQIVTSLARSSIHLRMTVRNESDQSVNATLWPRVWLGGRTVLPLPSRPVRVEPFATRVVETSARWPDPIPWGPSGYGEPVLYTLAADLRTPLGGLIDRSRTRFGFRELAFDGNQLTLNGKPVFLSGVRLGEEARRASTRDRHGLRRVFGAWMELGYNAVESHSESRPDAFYDVADETGMLVFSGNFCSGMVLDRGQGEGKDSEALRQLPATMAEWVKHERNHPSIIMWNTCDLSERLHPVLFKDIPDVDPTRLIPWASFQVFQAEIDDHYRITDSMRLPHLDASYRMPAFIAETFSPRNEPADSTAIRRAYFEEVRRRGYFGTIVPPDARAPAAAVRGVDWPSTSGPDARGDKVSVAPSIRAGSLVAPPELVVRVTAGDVPVPQPLVMALPLEGADGGPMGVMGDEHGRALLYLPGPGRWRIAWVDNDVRVSVDVDAPAHPLPSEGRPDFQEVLLHAPPEAYRGRK